MSGGEQQMCAIGRALMARPKLLLLDEPSMGLAPIFVEKIFEIVIEINQQGTPVLLVEQNALMALDIASRGYVLETGPRRARRPRRRAAGQRAGAQDVSRRGVSSSVGDGPSRQPPTITARRAARAAPRRGGCRRRRRAPSRARPPDSHHDRRIRRRQQHAGPVLPPATPRAISSAAGMLWVGTRPSARAAPASRQPPTSTRPARSSAGAHDAQSTYGSSGWGAWPWRYAASARGSPPPSARGGEASSSRLRAARGRGCGTAPAARGPTFAPAPVVAPLAQHVEQVAIGRLRAVPERAAEVVQQDDRPALAERRGIAPEPHRVAEAGRRRGDRVRRLAGLVQRQPRAAARRSCRAARRAGCRGARRRAGAPRRARPPAARRGRPPP